MTCRDTGRDLDPQVRGNLDLVFTRSRPGTETRRAISYGRGVVRVWLAAHMSRVQWENVTTAVMSSRRHRFLVVDMRQDGPRRYWHYRAPSAATIASRLLQRSAFSHAAVSASAAALDRADTGGDDGKDKSARRNWSTLPAVLEAEIARLSWLPDAVAMYSTCRRDHGRGTAYLARAAVSPRELCVSYPENVVVIERCVVPPHLRAVS